MLLGLWPHIKDDETLSTEMKKKFQKRMRNRAKTLADMIRRPSGKITPESYYSGGSDETLYDKNGDPIEKAAPRSRGADRKDDEPDIASLIQSDAERVGSKVNKMIKICYERVLKYNPMICGKIEVYVYAEGDGRVSETSIVFDEINNASMNKCILSSVKNTKFTFVEDAGAVSVPVTLTPGY